MDHHSTAGELVATAGYTSLEGTFNIASLDSDFKCSLHK